MSTVHEQHRKKKLARLSEGTEMRGCRGGENERNSSFLVVMVCASFCETLYFSLEKQEQRLEAKQRTPFLLSTSIYSLRPKILTIQMLF